MRSGNNGILTLHIGILGPPSAAAGGRPAPAAGGAPAAAPTRTARRDGAGGGLGGLLLI